MVAWKMEGSRGRWGRSMAWTYIKKLAPAIRKKFTTLWNPSSTQISTPRIHNINMLELKRDDVEKPHEENISPALSSQASTSGRKTEVPGENGVPISAKLKNPLSGFTREEMLADVELFAKEKDLEDIIPLLKKGALVAQNPKGFESIEELDDTEREWLRQEKSHRWNQPYMLYFMTGK
jgi:hypothetical protein